jgi:hypothetical protein
MCSPLSAAGAGLYQAVARATQSACNVVKASSTGENIDGDMVNLALEKTNVAVNAAVVKTTGQMQKALLDILA